MDNVIETQDLCRRFRRIEAVRDLSMQVPEGSIFAFVGPNGAGKTTTIKLLMSLLSPSQGQAHVLGSDSRRLGPAEFQRIGYVSENQELPSWMTVEELEAFYQPFYPSWDISFCARLKNQLCLPKGQKMRHLSRGMRMKTALLLALAYRPKLLILDEPFAGLDTLAREEFVQGILEMSENREWTVFISSHDIDEVERLTDWIGVLNRGQLQLCEPVISLQKRFRQFEVRMPNAGLPSNLPETWLVPESANHLVRFVESRYEPDKSDVLVKGLFPQAGQMEVKPMSLRSIFLALARTYRISN
jgi:ABC-2 type transport system ATP-binding protein